MLHLVGQGDVIPRDALHDGVVGDAVAEFHDDGARGIVDALNDVRDVDAVDLGEDLVTEGIVTNGAESVSLGAEA